MSNGASLAPQEIKIDFAVFPVATCQGLFNQNHLFFRPIFSEIPSTLSFLVYLA
jgi:hypothetical protein